MPSIINERIRKYRKEKKYSQGQLATKLGIKTSTYSQMEREGNVSADMVLRIAAVLGINPDLIFYEAQATSRPTTFTFRSPNTFEENLYGPQPELKTEPEDKPKNNLPFTLTNTEKNIITIYHDLPKAQQREIREFIQSIRERGR